MSTTQPQPNAQQQTTPGSMLEVYMHAIASSTNDSFLDQINLGTGNYDDSDYWHQLESFRQGLFADAGMTRKLMERARYETKQALVEAIYERPDSKILRDVNILPKGARSKREYFEEHGDRLWDSLGSEGMSTEAHQARLVHQVTGIPYDYTPPHWRFLKARHKTSQSKGARAMDDLFGRPPTPEIAAVEEFQ